MCAGSSLTNKPFIYKEHGYDAVCVNEVIRLVALRLSPLFCVEVLCGIIT